MTMTEKILARHSGNAGGVAPGMNVWTQVDKLMTHDVCGPGTFGIFQKEFGMDAQVRSLCLVSMGGACVAAAAEIVSAALARAPPPPCLLPSRRVKKLNSTTPILPNQTGTPQKNQQKTKNPTPTNI